MNAEKICAVYVTVPTEDEARRISRRAVEERLAACANIIGGVRSVYRWEGRTQEDDEIIIILKTRRSLISKLERMLEEMHSFECPCIVAYEAAHAAKRYEKWVLDNTGGNL
jgi:periplasmic divalent cation tolerance protein